MAPTIEELRESKTIAIIDGNSLMHRAFHAVPLTMNAPDGRATNACFGFISMLIKMIDEFAPDGVVCAFDAGRPAFRMEALEQYKAQRPPMDPLLKEQFPIIEGLLEAMDIPVVRIQGWEGDDILGTLGTRAENQGMDALLVTGDKDAYQLATDHVFIVTTKKGLSDVVIYDPDAVVDRYGVTPEQVPDFLGLKGDPSDNIPGVAGIGEKTAAKLLQEYGSLEGLFEHKDSLKGKMGDNVRAGEEDAYRSRLVATISHEVPIELDLESVHFPSFDPAAVREAFGKVRFMQHMNKVLHYAEEGGITSAATLADGAPLLGTAESGAVAINDPVLEGAAATDALDAALQEEHPTFGVVVYKGSEQSLFADETELYVALRSGVAHIGVDAALPMLARLIRTSRILCDDAKTLLHEVYPADSGEEALISRDELFAADIWDVGIAAYLLDSSRRDYSLPSLVSHYLGAELPPSDDEVAQTVDRCACLPALASALAERMEEDGSDKILADIEAPLIPVLVDMERTGVQVDTQVLDGISRSTAEKIEELKVQIYRTAGEQFNIDSPKQLGTVLFEKLKLPVVKKTKRGYSTDAKVLEKLRGKHPLPGLVEQYRELAKIKSTYLDVLPDLARASSDGRVHTTFNQTVTATGRLSSSDPNLQNIPVRTDFGRQIRTGFSPAEEDWVFLCADYSQIELRLLAHLSGDAGLIAAFNSGRDFHTATAARVFGVPEDRVDPAMRSRAKAVNFGIVYGQQAFGLGETLHIPYREAQEMIDRYYDAYPQVRIYLDDLVEFAREKGYVQTMFGRKRHIPEIHASNVQQRQFGERTAMNHPMQGSAADIIKLAMVEVDRRLRASNLRARLCLQVHDELDFEVHKDDADALGAMVAEVMGGIAKLDVPLLVSVDVAKTWAEAH